MKTLFDKMDVPALAGLTEDAAWKAIAAFEDWMYSNAESLSEESYDWALSTVSALRTEYYRLYE